MQTEHIVFAKCLHGDELCQAWCVLEARVEIVDFKRRFGHHHMLDYPIVPVDKASVLEFLCDVPLSAFCLVRLVQVNARKHDATEDESFDARCKRSQAIDVYMMIREQLQRTWGPLEVATLESEQFHSSLEISEMTTDDTDLRQFTDDLASTFGSFYHESNDGMRRAHSTSSLNSQSDQEMTTYDTDQHSFGEEGVHEDIAHAYIAPESDIVVCTSAPETATEPMNGLCTTPTVPMASGNVEINDIDRMFLNSNSFTPEQKKEIWSKVQEKTTPVAKSACRFLDLK